MNRTDQSTPITELLSQVENGRAGSSDELFSRVYEELRGLAGGRMCREAPGHTLQATALVHEAYMRLLGDQKPHFENRAHFFGAAAEAMRRILVDRARSRNRIKRGGELNRVPLGDHDCATFIPVDSDAVDLLALNEVLTRLEAMDSRMSSVVKLRYFVGMTIEETATVLGCTSRTVNRLWVSAKAWLHRELEQVKAA